MIRDMEGRSLLLTGPRHLEWVAERLPGPGPHELLRRTRAGAISISLGTELPLYQNLPK